jgi:DNA-binding HxlR family transcriptional regulator
VRRAAQPKPRYGLREGVVPSDGPSKSARRTAHTDDLPSQAPAPPAPAGDDLPPDGPTGSDAPRHESPSRAARADDLLNESRPRAGHDSPLKGPVPRAAHADGLPPNESRPRAGHDSPLKGPVPRAAHADGLPPNESRPRTAHDSPLKGPFPRTARADGLHEHSRWIPLAEALRATGDQWTLLIIAALAAEPLRLNELRVQLPGISAGVLDRYLQQMVDRDLIARRRYRELPPRVEYRLGPAGEELVPVALGLADWGARHMPTRPRATNTNAPRSRERRP